MMHGREKSDSAIVAVKPTNKAVPTAAEPVEPRAGAKGNARQQSTHRTQGRERVAQALERIRQVRRHSPKVGAVCGNSARTDLGMGFSLSRSSPGRRSFPSSVSWFDLKACFFVPTCASLTSMRAESVQGWLSPQPCGMLRPCQTIP